MSAEDSHSKPKVKISYENYLREVGMDKRTANVYRDLRGACRFSLQYIWKGAVKITETPYTPQRERLCMLWGINL